MMILKHIWRSVRRAPLQPLMIMLTLVLAVAMAVMSCAVSGMFVAYADQTERDAVAAGDILISMRADSDARILFEEDAAALLGEDGLVLGEFRLTGLTGEGERLSVSCTDLLAADRFYEFSYTVYGSFREKDLNRTAIVSERAAREHGLCVGQSLTVRLLEQEFTYTVGAIAADTGLLAQSDVLVSIDGIVATLTERMPIIASLGDSFHPYTRLMVKLADGVDANAVIERFSASPAFADKQVSLSSGGGYGDFWILLQLAFLWITLVMMLALVAVLIGTSLTLLHRRRTGEYALFVMAGASPAHLKGLVLLESMLYAVAGSLGGVLLAIPLTGWVSMFYEWSTEPLRLGAFDALFGLAFACLFMLLCTVLYLRRADALFAPREVGEGEQTPRGLLLGEWLPLSALLALSVLLMVFLPVAYRFWAGLTGALTLLLLLFVLTPHLIQWISRLFARLIARAGGSLAPLWLALKNLANRFSLRHAGRLLTVMLALLCALFTCERVLSNQLDLMTVESGEGMVAYGVSDEAVRELREQPFVQGVMQMSFLRGTVVDGYSGSAAISLSGDAHACVSEELLPSRLPAGDEAVLSRGLATLIGAEVGDRLECEIGGVPCTLTVTEILRCNANMLYYDGDALGIRHELLCISLAQGGEQHTESITATLESDGAMLLQSGSLFGLMPSSMSGHVRLLRVVLLLCLLLSLVGVANMLAQRRDVRLREHALLTLCGMTRRTGRAIAVLQTLLLLLVAGTLALAVGQVFCLMIDASLRSFGLLLFV